MGRIKHQKEFKGDNSIDHLTIRDRSIAEQKLFDFRIELLSCETEIALLPGDPKSVIT